MLTPMFEQLAFVRTQLSFLAITQLNKHNYKMSCVKIIKNNILTAILQSQIFILYKQLFLVPLFLTLNGIYRIPVLSFLIRILNVSD